MEEQSQEINAQTTGEENVTIQPATENISDGFDFDQFFANNQDGIKKALSTIMSGSPEEGEQQNDELQAKIKELAEKEQLLNRRMLENDTLKLLSETGLSANLMAVVIGNDIGTTAQNIKVIKAEVDSAVLVEVNNRLRGTPPGVSASNARSNEHIETMIKDIIRR